MYTYVITCRDIVNGVPSPVYLSDDTLTLFKKKEEAFEAAYRSAQEETEGLNICADEGVSFGIPEDELFQSME